MKIGCQFITIEPIGTKCGGNVKNLTEDATVALKMHFQKKSKIATANVLLISNAIKLAGRKTANNNVKNY